MKRFMKFIGKLFGKSMLWIGLETRRNGEPIWQVRLMAGVERDANSEENQKKVGPPTKS